MSEGKPVAPNLEFARDYQAKIPFIAHLGLVTEDLGEGMARMSVALEPHMTNSFGSAHGGVILTLLDVALCTAARTLHPDSVGVMTIDLSTSFIGAGSGKRLLAEARVLRDGRATIFVEAEAKNEGGELIAKAIGTVRALRRE
jgi:uncharacterized protein (TIGR00369 family)